MLRILIFFVVLAASAPAAILPEQMGQLKRGAISSASAPEPAIWQEFGFETGETATYSDASRSSSITAWRFRDTTGAFAALQARRTAVQCDNYLVEADKPANELRSQFCRLLPNRISTALPPLFTHLPAKARINGSERYLLGPASLAQFEPRLTKELVAFDRGAEGASARYRSGSTEVQLTVFSYPTPQMAIERFRSFEKVPDAAVKRSGTLIAIVPDGKKIPLAGKIIEDVNYSPKLTWNEYVPKATTQDAAKMILAISLLAAGLIVASVILGLFFGGGKVLARRFGMKPAEEDFTSLHISDRSETAI